MKKLVSASIMLLSVCSAMIVVPPASAQAASGQAASGQPASCGAITIKEPAEYNAYANATSQSTPQAKAQAIEAFLTQYPNSVAKVDLLGQLMTAYSQANDVAKTLEAAKRLMEADPNNLRALTFVVYLEKQQAGGNQAALDQAAADAQKGLNATKDQCMSQADYDTLKDAATPVFYSTIGADDAAKKDYKGAIDAYTKELQSYKDPAQTTTMKFPGLLDTVYLGQAYLQEDSKDPNNQKEAVWFLIRAAQFVPAAYKAQIETQAEYWYKKYHCAQNDAACQAKPDGLAAIQQLAAVPANIFPPASYNPTQAPPPPSPQDLAHQAIVGTTGCENVTPAPPKAPAPGAAAPAATPAPAAAPATPPTVPQACSDNLKNSLALSDKEFILANGDLADQQVIWSVMNGVTAEVPGVVVTATADSVQIAVTQDAQQSNKADFTVNMKEPLKTVPAAGTKVTYIATFDSYTQSPPMIILKDGEPKEAPKPVVHHTAHHPAR